MPDSLEQLRADATDTIERGMAPDRIVLRAIGLGCDTRKSIKEATGLDCSWSKTRILLCCGRRFS